MQKELIDKERVQEIKEYYKTCNLWIPNKSAWRSWKFKLKDGSYKRFHIKNKTELRELLTKFAPIRVYYSAIAIYNIRNVKGKATKNQMKIFRDSIIDLDNPNFKECRKSAIEVIKRLGPADYILKTFKGLHICYYKKKIDYNLIKDIRDFDKKTFENEYNEFSCPGTLNKGKVCTFITYKQLIDGDINQEKIYNHILCDSMETSERPQANDQAETHLNSVGSGKNQSEVKKEGTRSEVSVLLSFNNIAKSGKHKLFVPILIYDKSSKWIKNELDRLNSIYNLGNLYCFESQSYYAFVSIRCFEQRQLEKLLNQSSSITRAQQSKFSKTWLNISEFQLIGVLRYKTNKFFRCSLKHYNFLIDCGINIQPVDELVGHPKLQIIEVHTS